MAMFDERLADDIPPRNGAQEREKKRVMSCSVQCKFKVVRDEGRVGPGDEES